jgi:hypothetical protein
MLVFLVVGIKTYKCSVTCSGQYVHTKFNETSLIGSNVIWGYRYKDLPFTNFPRKIRKINKEMCVMVVEIYCVTLTKWSSLPFEASYLGGYGFNSRLDSFPLNSMLHSCVLLRLSTPTLSPQVTWILYCLISLWFKFSDYLLSVVKSYCQAYSCSRANTGWAQKNFALLKWYRKQMRRT